MLLAVLGYFVGIQIVFGGALREASKEVRGISQAVSDVRHLVTAGPNLGQRSMSAPKVNPCPETC